MVNNDAANQAIDDTDGKAKKTSLTFGEMIGSAARVGAGIALAMGTAVLAVGGLAVSLTDDLQKSLNGVQASTGATDEAMVGMKDTMLAIYNNNFGENFEEIASVMGIVTQQTGLAGEELQKMTEGAFALRDTFEMDVAGSVETAGIMMKTFGVDSTEAYNLIAQGAQNGLNKQGDLLDILKEYGPHFATLGFSAEEAMNMLVNGAKGGVFSVDQLGDVVHEFGRQMKESDVTEPLEKLGLNASKYTAMVAAGGAQAKQAFTEIGTKLGEMTDKTKQTEIGLALYGDMWGEVQAEGVLAMSNTQGAISNTVDALGKINEVKYNTFGEATEGIKRNLETGILIPLGEEIMPMMNEFASWIRANMPEIKANIANAMEYASKIIIFVKDNGETLIKVLGFLGTAWVVHKVYVIATTIATEAMTIAMGAQKLATWASTAAQWLFNGALSANPIGVVVLAIAGLGLILLGLVKNWDKVTGAIKTAWEWLKNWNNTPAKDKTATTTYINKDGTANFQPIKNHAKGTNFFEGGITRINEEGGEILNLPRGTQIIPHDVSMAMASNGNNGALITGNTFVIREEADIDKIAERLFRKQQGQQRSLGVRT